MSQSCWTKAVGDALKILGAESPPDLEQPGTPDLGAFLIFELLPADYSTNQADGSWLWVRTPFHVQFQEKSRFKTLFWPTDGVWLTAIGKARLKVIRNATKYLA